MTICAATFLPAALLAGALAAAGVFRFAAVGRSGSDDGWMLKAALVLAIESAIVTFSTLKNRPEIFAGSMGAVAPWIVWAGNTLAAGDGGPFRERALCGLLLLSVPVLQITLAVRARQRLFGLRW